MKQQPIGNSRLLFIVVSILTLILLIGSVVLERIVFRAEQVSGSVLLSPATWQVGQGQTFAVSLQSDLATTAYVSALQTQINWPSDKVELVKATPEQSWQTISLNAKSGEINWAIAPATTFGTLVPVQGQTAFGRLEFKAVSTGSVSFKFSQNHTILAAVDLTNQLKVYNAATLVQGNSGTIGDLSSHNTTPVTSNLSSVAPITDFQGQKLTIGQPIILPTSALLVVKSQQTSLAKLEFGLTEKLGSSVEDQQLSNDRLLKIVGLEPNARYYYRVSIGATSSSQVSGQIRSFTTGSFSSSPVDVSKSEFLAEPAQGQSLSTLYVVLRDSQGQAVRSDQVPTLSILAGKAQLESVSQNEGLYSSSLIADSQAGHQQVVILASLNSQPIGESTVTFDPKTGVSQTNQNQEAQVILGNKTWLILLLTALIGLVCGSLVVRLTRQH